MELAPDSRYTRRLELRPFRKRDVEPLLEAVTCSMHALHPWLPWASPAYGRVDATRFVRESMRAFREHRAYDFAIRGGINSRFDADQHLGNVSIWHMSRAFRAGEVGYWIRSDAAGTGLATEAAARLVQVGFEELRLHRVVLRIAVGNRASERVAEKLGFVKEGILREELEVHGEWLDHTVYSLLEHEYAQRRSALADVVGA